MVGRNFTQAEHLFNNTILEHLGFFYYEDSSPECVSRCMQSNSPVGARSVELCEIGINFDLIKKKRQ